MLKINQKYINSTVKSALNEDLKPYGDITTKLNNFKKKNSKAKIIAKQNGVIAGLDFCKTAFKIIDKNIKFKTKIKDGKKIKKNKIIAEIEGKTKAIITGERTALNFLNHSSGIATSTNQFVKKKKYNDLILDEKDKVYKINGSSFTGITTSNALIGSWWNHNILQSNIIISPLSGSLKHQEVYFLSKETIKIDNSFYDTSRFKIVMKKQKDDKKKEEFNVWLDEKSKIILKVSYSKLGNWEYIVKNIEKFN